MDQTSQSSLLPAGLQDLLPPHAAQEATIVRDLLAVFVAQGYQHVKPPLLEFEEALLSGTGAALGGETFRLMDPVSQRMMGLRADITPQVVRLAASRLGRMPRPLRLCYAGQVLRVRGSQLRPERQFTQVGLELIGAPQAAADAEAVRLGTEALTRVGIPDLSVDLNLPPLVGVVAAELGLAPAETAALRQALDGKDASAVSAIAGEQSDIFLQLLRAAGPAEAALPRLGALALPQAALDDLERLALVVGMLQDALPGLAITIDPVEHRGFEYQTGISFIYFARGVRGELGRGGRYPALAGDGHGNSEETQSCTGVTLYMDTVLRAVPFKGEARRLYLPFGTPAAAASQRRDQGWVTVQGLEAEADLAAAARHMGCGHLLRDGEIVALAGDG